MTMKTQLQERKTLKDAIIRFAGDSGDGMQLVGGQFTQTSAIQGNDVNTFPDFPAEIRAPAGTLPGVSGFQINFSSEDIRTPGDELDVLVAMNPAALKTQLPDLKPGGILIVNSDSFADGDLKKARYESNPLETGELDGYRLVKMPVTELTLEAVKESGLPRKQAERCKNMFALGVVFWLYDRSVDYTVSWIHKKFARLPAVAAANDSALRAGYNYASTIELFTESYRVTKANLPPGRYRQISGNQALAFGCAAVAVRSGAPMLLSSYPITPASDFLHDMAGYKHFGISTFQAEDEISAVCSAIGASFGGGLSVTSTSGPGLALKSEGLGYAVMAELPLVVVDIQRAGPSTGMPTKTEQSDLLLAAYGRHGECPMPVLAPATPGDCFYIIIEAFRIALRHMTPVLVLSDGYLANGAEPWKIPDIDELPALEIRHATEGGAYDRDPRTFARAWAVPGTPGLEHRVGGLEKDSLTGNVSYNPANHAEMTRIRAAKVESVEVPPLEVSGADSGSVLVVSWGGTYGSVTTAVEALQGEGRPVSSVHLRHLVPFPPNLGDILKRFEKVLVCELNGGQLCSLLRSRYLVEAMPFTKVEGKPFLVSEIKNRIMEAMK